MAHLGEHVEGGLVPDAVLLGVGYRNSTHNHCCMIVHGLCHVLKDQLRECQGHPQMYYLPQAEGVLLHVFDNRSRVCG